MISYKNKNFKIIVVSISSLVLFLSVLYFYLEISNTGVKEFIFQYLVFPSEIGKNRQANFDLNFKNVFLDFKFIYLFLIPILIIILKRKSKKNFLNSLEFNFFLLIFFYTVSLIYHQIYTKNQIFIFFLIPILCSIF